MRDPIAILLGRIATKFKEEPFFLLNLAVRFATFKFMLRTAAKPGGGDADRLPLDRRIGAALSLCDGWNFEAACRRHATPFTQALTRCHDNGSTRQRGLCRQKRVWRHNDR
jgi:hypothetical protein